METFKNQDFKKFTVYFMLLSLVFIVLTNMLLYVTMEELSKNVIKTQTAFVGKVYSANPSLSSSFISAILSSPSDEDMASGEEILRNYGYVKDMNITYNSTFNAIYPKIFLLGSLSVFIFFLALYVLQFISTNRMYNSIRTLSRVAEKIVEGDFSLKANENIEGDLGKLGLEFNKMIYILKENLETLQTEKIFLKTTMSDISHQLKTPMTSLIMLNDIMLQDRNLDANTRYEFLSKSSTQLTRMDWLIKSMLKLARIEAGAIKFDKNYVPAEDLIKEALDFLKPNLDEKNHLVTLKGSASIFVDSHWTVEALINIIKNSIEHSPMASSIDISISATSIYSEIIIKDHGEGIDKKDLPHVFERFYKCSSSSKSDSIGIGLAMSKSIIENQDGYIKVESKKNKGSAFTITFLNGII